MRTRPMMRPEGFAHLSVLHCRAGRARVAGSCALLCTLLVAVAAISGAGCSKLTEGSGGAGPLLLTDYAHAHLNDGIVGVPYSDRIIGVSGIAPHRYSTDFLPSDMPAGLSLDPLTGVISGTLTPAALGPDVSSDQAYTLKFIVTDAANKSAKGTFFLTVKGIAALSIETVFLPAGAEGFAYPATPIVLSAGGTAPVVFTVTAGALPVGLSMSPDGIISGMAATGHWGTEVFTVTAADALGLLASREFHIVISPLNGFAPLEIAGQVLPVGTVGIVYPGAQMTLTPGKMGQGIVTFAVSAGALPPGLVMDAAGIIAGIPTVEANPGVPFTVTATDSLGHVVNKAFALPVGPPGTFALLEIAAKVLPNGTVGTVYAGAQIELTPGKTGDGTVTFAVTAGALPAGLAMSASGFIGDVPTAVTLPTASFTVRATDSGGHTAERAFALVVGPATGVPPLEIAPAILPGGQEVLLYAGAQIALTPGKEGVGAVTFSVGAGALPLGLSLSASGAISGTPYIGSWGTSTFTIVATDQIPQTASRAFSITVAVAPNAYPAVFNLATSGNSGNITITFDTGDLDGDDIMGVSIEYSTNGGNTFAPITAATMTAPFSLPAAPGPGYTFTWDTSFAGDDVAQSAPVNTVQLRVYVSDAAHSGSGTWAWSPIFTVNNSPTLAAGTTSIIANWQQAARGSQVTVGLRIVLGTGHSISAIQCDVVYDPAVFTPANPTGQLRAVDLANPPQPNNKDGPTNGSILINTPSVGLSTYRILTYGGTTQLVSGPLFNLTMNIAAGAATGMATLTVSNIQAADVAADEVAPVAGVSGGVLVK